MRAIVACITFFLGVTVSAWAGTWSDNFNDGDLDGWETFEENRGLEKWTVENGEASAESFGTFAILYTARDEARPDSDLDLLIVHQPLNFDPVKRFVKLTFELENSTEFENLQTLGLSPRPSAIFMTEAELWQRPHILLDILDHGIILFDTSVLNKRLEALRTRLLQLGAKKVILKDGSWYWDLKPDWKPGEIIEL